MLMILYWCEADQGAQNRATPKVAFVNMMCSKLILHPLSEICQAIISNKREGDDMTFKEARIKAGYSQTQLAKLLEVTQPAISHWESGDWIPLGKYRLKIERLLKTKEIEWGCKEKK